MPESQDSPFAPLPPMFQQPRLAAASKPREAEYLHTTSIAALPTFPTDVLHAYASDAAKAPSVFATLKTHGKQLARTLAAVFKGRSCQDRKSEVAVTINPTTSNTAIINPATLNTAIGDTIAPILPGHRDAAHNRDTDEIARYNALQGSTWNVLIHIFYTPSETVSDIRRSALGRFDSQSPYDLISSTYAANCLGLRFDKDVPQELGRTITGETVYSIGKVKARWAPEQDTSSSSLSGEEKSIYAKSYYADFHVIKADHFDVYIGHPSLLANGLYGIKPKLLNPFRPSPSAPATPAQDQAYLQRLEEERKREEQFKQQQAQGSPKS